MEHAQLTPLPGDAEHVAQWARELGVHVDAVQVGQMVAFLECVLAKNETVNLTAIREFDRALRLHIVDSLAAVNHVRSAPPGEVVDVGSGAGFPGVPVAVVSGRRTVLLESVTKKADATRECIRVLSSDVRVGVRAERSEEYSAEHPSSAAAVLCRGVGDLATVLELGAPLTILGGRVIAMKGDLTQEELDRGARVADLLGLSSAEVSRFTLPGGGERRSIAVYTREGEGRVRLPRRPGLAQKRPLAT